MYNEQAKNGFKTFSLTLVISLVAFGAIYYVMTSASSVDIEDSSALGNNPVSYKADTEDSDVMGASNYKSVFGEISEKPVKGSPSMVLASTTTTTTANTNTTENSTTTTESTESATVPDTGSEQILGISLAITAFGGALYFLQTKSRNFALSEFEKDVISDQ